MAMFLLKMFGYLFPFIKELFLGKSPPGRKKKGQMEQKNKFLKLFLIGVGLASFLLCIFLAKRLYEVSKQYNDLVTNPPVIVQPQKQDPQPTPQVVEQETVEDKTPPSPDTETTKPPMITGEKHRKSAYKPKPIKDPEPDHTRDRLIKRLKEIEECHRCDHI